MKTFVYIFALSSVIFFAVTDRSFKETFLYSEYDRDLYYKSLLLAKKNAELEASLNRVNYKLKKLESENYYLTMNSKKTMSSEPGRGLASVDSANHFKIEYDGKDHVQYDIYRWGEYKLHSIANREYSLENYQKASQFYIELINQYPQSKYITEGLLLKSAYSCYQTGRYHHQAISILDMMLRKYPHSKHYLKAKLWRGLASYQTGNYNNFTRTIEEFRKKYRNTKEWELLKNYYEKIVVNSQSL